MSHQRGLAQTLMSEEKFSDALAVYQKLADLMPDDADIYCALPKSTVRCINSIVPKRAF